MPLISHLFGVINEYEQDCPPITIMPEKGAHDRVPIRSPNTYYEIKGTWGDDSQYLVGMSTSLIVCAPFGAWTQIEVANGLAQGKPIAFLCEDLELEKLPVKLRELIKDAYDRNMVFISNDGEAIADWISAHYQVKLEFDKVIDMVKSCCEDKEIKAKIEVKDNIIKLQINKALDISNEEFVVEELEFEKLLKIVKPCIKEGQKSADKKCNFILQIVDGNKNSYEFSINQK